MNGLLRFALGIANMPQKTIDDLDKSLPGFSRLVKLAQAAEPAIKRCAPHIEAMKPDLIQLTDLIEKAWPDIEAVLPTVDELIIFAQDTPTN